VLFFQRILNVRVETPKIGLYLCTAILSWFVLLTWIVFYRLWYHRLRGTRCPHFMMSLHLLEDLKSQLQYRLPVHGRVFPLNLRVLPLKMFWDWMKLCLPLFYYHDSLTFAMPSGSSNGLSTMLIWRWCSWKSLCFCEKRDVAPYILPLSPRLMCRLMKLLQ
jgi:hypothetical protein